MEVHPKKTKIYPVKKGTFFLGFLYKVTETGKVLIFADPAKIKHEKKKLKRMVRLAKEGKRSRREVDAHFKAYKECVRYGTSRTLIHKLNIYYKDLWKGEEVA